MWTKELVQLLLNQYQEYESLYNVRHPHYINRIKRSEALFKIFSVLKEKDNGISIEAIKNKIHTLRSQYIKELRTIANSKSSGVGADHVYTPKLWCFDQLQFLHPHTATRPSVSNILSENESEQNSIDVDFHGVSADEPGPSRKRKPSTSYDENIKQMKSLIENRMKEKNEYDWLGQEVMFEIKNLKNDDIRRNTIWKIQCTLHEASIADLNLQNRNRSEVFIESGSSGISTTAIGFPPRPVLYPPTPSPPIISQPETNQNFSTPASALTENDSTACTTDILQLSLAGLLDDEDFLL